MNKVKDIYPWWFPSLLRWFYQRRALETSPEMDLLTPLLKLGRDKLLLAPVWKKGTGMLLALDQLASVDATPADL
jgi:hypothetical protein